MKSKAQRNLLKKQRLFKILILQAELNTLNYDSDKEAQLKECILKEKNILHSLEKVMGDCLKLEFGRFRKVFARSFFCLF